MENCMKSSALSTASQQAYTKIIAIVQFKQCIHRFHTEIVQKRISIHYQRYKQLNRCCRIRSLHYHWLKVIVLIGLEKILLKGIILKMNLTKKCIPSYKYSEVNQATAAEEVNVSHLNNHKFTAEKQTNKTNN